MRLEILPSAWSDLADGFAFYEARESGLGGKFRETLIADIERIALASGAHRKVFGLHRALARRFPFAIYYSLKDDVILVRAVLDCRRDPKGNRGKLSR